MSHVLQDTTALLYLPHQLHVLREHIQLRLERHHLLFALTAQQDTIAKTLTNLLQAAQLEVTLLQQRLTLLQLVLCARQVAIVQILTKIQFPVPQGLIKPLLALLLQLVASFVKLDTTAPVLSYTLLSALLVTTIH